MRGVKRQPFTHAGVIKLKGVGRNALLVKDSVFSHPAWFWLSDSNLRFSMKTGEHVGLFGELLIGSLFCLDLNSIQAI